MKRYRVIGITLLILAGIGMIAYALLTSTNYQYTVEIAGTGGGDTSASTNYRYGLTVGQPSATDTIGTSNYVMKPGFWYQAAPAHSGSVWYVNAATGHDTLGSGNLSSPFKTITRALVSVGTGETIQISAGTYAETVVIKKSALYLVGADSRTTVIDPPGASSTAGLYGILAQNVSAVTIKNLGVTGAYTGVRFDNADLSTVTGDSFGSNDRHGMELVNGSDTNTITLSEMSRNIAGSGFGIEMNNSQFNTVSNSIFNSNGQYGVYLQSSAHKNTVSGNTVNSNSSKGMFLLNSSNLTVSANTVNSNSGEGIHLNSGSGGVISGNTANSNSTDGILVDGGSSCVVSGNTAVSNQNGAVITNSSAAIVTRNVLSSNSKFGLKVTSASNLYAAQNTLTSNVEYQISLGPSATGSLIERNNIKTSSTFPDSGALNTTNAAHTLTRNWWNTTDELAIGRMTYDTAATKLISFKPFRLGQVDTSTGADTVAPIEPQNVAVSNATGGVLTLTWANATVDEDSGVLSGFGGVRIYRLTGTTDTTHWANAHIAFRSAGVTTFADTAVSGGNTYYYRMASEDTAAQVNLSFFSDTRSGVPTLTGSPESVVIVSGNHQVISGASAVLVMDVKDTFGTTQPGETVSFSVSYDGGAPASLPTGVSDTTGRLTYTATLSSGEGVYVITASTRPGAATDDAIFVVYTSKRKVAANKWTMFAPFKMPNSSLTGLAQLTYGGTALSYWYDPSETTAHATFSKYRSITGQAAPNVSAVGTFSQYDIGRAYWFKTTVATGLGLADTATAQTDTARIRLVPGANMVGNPFPHFIDWLDDVSVALDTAADTTRVSLRSLSAVGTPAIDTRLQWRDQAAEQYVNAFAVGETSVQLKPWAGFWVKANLACTLVYVPTKRIPQTDTVERQAPRYVQRSTFNVQGSELNNWKIQLKAYTQVSEIRDEYTFIGVAPAALDGEDPNDMWKAPGMAGDLQVWVGEPAGSGREWLEGGKYYAASIAAPIQTAVAWPVRITGPAGTVTLAWDAGELPEGYGAYLLGGPAGPVDLLKSASAPIALNSSADLLLAVGSPEHLAAFLAAPLSKDQTFVYPNPGPAADGQITFKYNLPAAGDVNLKIFDVGGKLVKEMRESGGIGSNMSLRWDTTNRHGQKVGSGVYIYILESGGVKLTDKLAIVR